MLFNSVIFIMVFLPLTLLGFFSLQQLKNPIYAKLFLTGASLFFYGYYNPWYLLLLGGSLLCNHGCSKLFELCKGQKSRRLVLIAGLFVNLGILFYFKYFNFFIDNCNMLLHTDWNIEKIALPLGISFFTFQQISYVVDRYRNDAPYYSLLDYACFITFFPQLIAGPIVLHSEFVPQLAARKNRKPDAEKFFDGFSLFILGLGKKVLLADVLARPVNAAFDDINIIRYYIDFPTGWLIILFYAFELYFDFSGYCDMARGISKMFGFELPINFDSPFKSETITEFWRRWHITLSRFLTTYIYIPLGGNRRGTAIRCRNTLIVFFISGIWHGASWNFIFWGLFHGFGMITENLFPKLRLPWAWLRKVVTFLFFTLSMVLFRSDSLQTAGLYLKRMFTADITPYLSRLGNSLQLPETFAITKLLQLKAPELVEPFNLVVFALLFIISCILIAGPKAEEWLCKKGRTRRGLFLLATIFTWSLISLSQVSTFLYFNF
ncbi:MAG: MBOAT family protein [Lachnospiraceae bacterium]|nr:MBOAT family protein [Lachnospiraceae bacterium]